MKNQQRLAHYSKSASRKSATFKFPRGKAEYPVTPAQRRRLKHKRFTTIKVNPTPQRGKSRKPGAQA